MRIYVDDGLSDDEFFLSIPVSETELLCFESSIRGQRVLTQKLVEHDPLPAGDPVHGEWDMIIVDDDKITGRTHVRWIDQGRYDWYNDCTWEIVSEQPMPDDMRDVILAYSKMIRHHEKDLGRFAPQIKQMQMVLKTIAKKKVGARR
jgi:hypothetical protein